MELKDRIKQARKRLGYTQDELAKTAGISRESIINYETRGRMPPADVLKKLADVLKVSTDELLYGRMMADDLAYFRSTKFQKDMNRLGDIIDTGTQGMMEKNFLVLDRDDRLKLAKIAKFFRFLNKEGRARLEQDAKLYYNSPDYQDETAIAEYNVEEASDTIKITLPIMPSQYTKEEEADYEEVQARLDKDDTQKQNPTE